MPQTMEEHLDELEDDASEDHASISSFEDDQVSNCCHYKDKVATLPGNVNFFKVREF